jgi:HK97 family phage major capsid protein
MEGKIETSFLSVAANPPGKPKRTIEMKLNELRSARAAKQRELDSLVATEETRSLQDNEVQRFQTLESEINALDEKISRAQRRDDLDRRAQADTVNGTGLRDLDRAVAEFRVGALIAHAAGMPNAPDAARELEVAAEFQRRNGGEGYAIPFAALLPRLERREISWGGGSGSGSGLVFETELPDSIPALRPSMIVGGLGARIIDNLSGGPVSISKITSGKTAEFIAEGGSGTFADPSTGKVQLSPKQAIALTSLSNSMLRQSSASAQALVNADILAAVTGAIDRVAIAGGGSNEPSGVWDTVTATSITNPTREAILEMVEGVEIANVPGARLGFASHPSVVRKLRSTPAYTWGSPATDGMGGFIQDGARELVDYPLASSTSLPTTGSPVTAAGLIFGDWSQLLVGVYESVNILVNPYRDTEFKSASVAIRATASVDVALRYDEAFETRTVTI